MDEEAFAKQFDGQTTEIKNGEDAQEEAKEESKEDEEEEEDEGPKVEQDVSRGER